VQWTLKQAPFPSTKLRAGGRLPTSLWRATTDKQGRQGREHRTMKTIARHCEESIGEPIRLLTKVFRKRFSDTLLVLPICWQST